MALGVLLVVLPGKVSSEACRGGICANLSNGFIQVLDPSQHHRRAPHIPCPCQKYPPCTAQVWQAQTVLFSTKPGISALDQAHDGESFGHPHGAKPAVGPSAAILPRLSTNHGQLSLSNEGVSMTVLTPLHRLSIMKPP